MTDQEYTVDKVTGLRDVTLPHGQFKSYTVVLQGDDQQVGLLQKPETAPPKHGDTLFGHIEEKNGFRNFKKAQRQGGFAGGPRPEDPKRAARILRQHSQHMALLYAEIRARQGKLPDGFTVKDLFQIADAFDRDAEHAGDRA